MKFQVDTDKQILTVENNGATEDLDLYSDAAFERLSDLWVKVGWNQKYTYTFTWMGRPIIQMPEDMLRIQEVIHTIKPNVIVETGIAHGGSLIFYASLFKTMGKGRVIGIDVEIRPHNRKAIEEHPLYSYITMFEGSSVDPDIVSAVKDQIKPGETVMVFLDSNHLKDHVQQELELYSSLVSQGSYIVAMDGVMQDLADVPRGEPTWDKDNPVEAVRDFLQNHPEFTLEQPAWNFNESGLDKNITYWPSAWLRKS